MMDRDCIKTLESRVEELNEDLTDMIRQRDYLEAWLKREKREFTAEKEVISKLGGMRLGGAAPEGGHYPEGAIALIPHSGDGAVASPSVSAEALPNPGDPRLIELVAQYPRLFKIIVEAAHFPGLIKQYEEVGGDSMVQELLQDAAQLPCAEPFQGFDQAVALAGWLMKEPQPGEDPGQMLDMEELGQPPAPKRPRMEEPALDPEPVQLIADPPEPAQPPKPIQQAGAAAAQPENESNWILKFVEVQMEGKREAREEQAKARHQLRLQSAKTFHDAKEHLIRKAYQEEAQRLMDKEAYAVETEINKLKQQVKESLEKERQRKSAKLAKAKTKAPKRLMGRPPKEREVKPPPQPSPSPVVPIAGPCLVYKLDRDVIEQDVDLVGRALAAPKGTHHEVI